MTHRRNTASFERCDLVPNVLRGVETSTLGDRDGPEARRAVLLLADCPPTPVPSSGRTGSGGRCIKVRDPVRRVLARHSQPGGSAQGVHHAAGVSVLLSQGSRPQSRHDAARQGGWRRSDDADRRQHHRRKPRARPAHRFLDPVQADARRDAPVRDQADVGPELLHPRTFQSAPAGQARRHGRRGHVDRALLH